MENQAPNTSTRGKSEPPILSDESTREFLRVRINNIATEHGDYYLNEGMKESQAFVAILSAFTNILRELDEHKSRAASFQGMLEQLKAARPKVETPPLATMRAMLPPVGEL